MFVYVVAGPVIDTFIEWVASQDLQMEMNVRYERGRIQAAYVLFGRGGHSKANVKEINTALSSFRQTFKGLEGISWEKEPELVKAA